MVNEKSKKVVPNKIHARVVGYYRAVNDWNDGKQKEWSTRKIITGLSKR